MNPKRKAYLEQQRLREEQAKQTAAASVAPSRRVEVMSKHPVHDGNGGKYECGAVVSESDETREAIGMWLAKGWARLTT